MQIGEIIRKYRKEKNMTQEEMANRLGVTAPAVNKWERGASMPDILLLAPIARLLDITVDTLLSFREELTEEEINRLIEEENTRMQTQSYAEAFCWVKQQLEQYPNCDRLIYRMALILDSWRMLRSGKDEEGAEEKYDRFICDCYERSLAGSDEEIRNMAADSLYGFYMRKEQYDRAEEYLTFFSKENPERKRKQAALYSRTGRTEEAYRSYEELIFSHYQMMSIALHGIYSLAQQEQDYEKAHKIVQKQKELAGLCEMGTYHTIAYELELATAEKDREKTITLLQELLSCIGTICDFQKSFLYEHMDFNDPGDSFIAETERHLRETLREDEEYAFLRDDPRWESLFGEA